MRFSTNISFYLENEPDKAIVTMEEKRKLYESFRMIPVPMALSDL